MKKINKIILRKNAKSKINLGDIAKNVSSYYLTKDKNRIINIAAICINTI
jgi:nucleosome binding factor SPN SPT16 subunit